MLEPVPKRNSLCEKGSSTCEDGPSLKEYVKVT